MTTDIQEQQQQQQQQKLNTVSCPSTNQQQGGGMLLLEPYQPTVFMEDDWDNSLSLPSLANDNQEEDLFATMDFVDVTFPSSLPATPSNSAPQSPSIPSDKSMNYTNDNSSAEELLSMLMQTYCPHISST